MVVDMLTTLIEKRVEASHQFKWKFWGKMLLTEELIFTGRRQKEIIGSIWAAGLVASMTCTTSR